VSGKSDTAIAPTSEQLLAMYTTMVRIRAFETRMSELFLEGKLPGFLHPYIGEEAIASGVMAALRDDDYIASTHRGHGHLLAKGGDAKLMAAELYGRATGYCRGKGGSMHIVDRSLGILGANGIVGAGMPIATGAGLAIQYQGKDGVAVGFFGDGASNRGVFHESLNMAALWNLPVLFVCENNFFGEFTRQPRHQKKCDIAGRAEAYGVPGVCVDGNDVEAVYAAAAAAVARARNGEGPSVIECQTWRHGPHDIGEPQKYRRPKEDEAWLKKDPIPRCAKKIVEMGIASQEDVDRIAADATAEMQEAAEFGEQSPITQEEDVLTDVYSG
jgi:acetoin:2,6-dichlorophenolindophenol oxidoreductase subunit alpha